MSILTAHYWCRFSKSPESGPRLGGAGAVRLAALAAVAALWAMPTTARGQIFVVNGDSGTIDEYTTSGATVNASLVSGLSFPEGIAVVPEPSTWAMLATGASALFVFGSTKLVAGRRRKNKGARPQRVKTGTF